MIVSGWAQCDVSSEAVLFERRAAFIRVIAAAGRCDRSGPHPGLDPLYKRVGNEVLLSDLPRRVLARGADDIRSATVDRAAVVDKIERGTMSLKDEVVALQRVAIEEALKRTSGNAAQAARLLGEVGRGVARDPGGTLRAMMRRLRSAS
jgi:Bacterial regulatory protein, Fis family